MTRGPSRRNFKARSLLDGISRAEEKKQFKEARKQAEAAGETVPKPNVWQVVPNRADLRARGFNINKPVHKPFGRLTRFRLAPSSLKALVAIHQPTYGPDGSLTGVRKFVVPRENLVRKEE